ncbi:MAG TPA: alpha-glucan family phosphorylase [Puia sp.]|jgi:starch phosphorylase|nr:alpha-glucan family phosphorylase [Puia sp.]
MNTVKMHYGNPLYDSKAAEIEGFDSLVSLALDMRWSWNRLADELWKQLDPELWEQTFNPWLVIQSVSGEQLRHLFGTPTFRDKLDSLLRDREEEDAQPSWFHTNYPNAQLKTVAYFSMEFMLGESLPIYVGGLGNVAGDQLKSASDLGVPVIGVGLLYQRGYFRQFIDTDGEQVAYHPFNDPGQLPVTPLRLPNGEWLRLEVRLLGRPFWLRAWQARVGRATLFLLDSNDPANSPDRREITAEVYGGDSEMRIMQEVVLGIGGWRLFEQLGISPEVCHLNEGHAAFAILERAHDYMEASGSNFETALAVTRAGNLFTTHTAVPAGFDRFDPALVARHLGPYAQHRLRIPLDDLLALGRIDPHDQNEPFNMAYLAVRGSSAVNGVSKLHGAVSRHLFEPLFQRWPTEEVPIHHVTNGIHTPTWESQAASRLWTEAIGQDRWKDTTESFSDAIKNVSDEKIWNMRRDARKSLIDYIREHQATHFVSCGAPPEVIDKARRLFDPGVLTIGFARRFVAYKRPDLLLSDPDRLARLLADYKQPVQLVIAGKAPPYDDSARDLIRRWIMFIRNYGLEDRVVFLDDYDMLMAGYLVGGMDVWLNTPQRPWEASGTSGMKVLVNGGLNLSELDGWWVEAYRPEVGWALGDGLEHGNDPTVDRQEAQALFALLEQQVIPQFYHRNANGIPVEWIKKVRESMATLTPFFSSNRTVREYTEKFYLPAATTYQARAAQNSDHGKKIVEWKHNLEQHWPNLGFGRAKVETKDNMYVFNVQVYPHGLDPASMTVQLVAAAPQGNGHLFVAEMLRSGQADAAAGWIDYCAWVPATRPIADYTARIIPHNAEVAIPLEYDRIIWQH